MWDQAVGAGIDLGTQIGSDQMNYYVQRKSWDKQSEAAQRQAEWNKDAQERSNQWNIDQWNRQNAYNHPAMHMQRMKEAGLNPRLMYGSNSQNIGTAGPVAPSKAAQSYQRPDYRNNFRSQVKSNFGEAVMNAVRASKIEKENEVLGAQAYKLKWEGEEAKSRAGESERYWKHNADAMEYKAAGWKEDLKDKYLSNKLRYRTYQDELTLIWEKVAQAEDQTIKLRTERDLKILEKQEKEIHYQMMKDGYFDNTDPLAKWLYMNADQMEEALKYAEDYLPKPLLVIGASLLGIKMKMKNFKRGSSIKSTLKSAGEYSKKVLKNRKPNWSMSQNQSFLYKQLK